MRDYLLVRSIITIPQTTPSRYEQNNKNICHNGRHDSDV